MQTGLHPCGTMGPSVLVLFLGGIAVLCSQIFWASANLHTDICSLPPLTGPCLALFTRWYYNPWARKCLAFTYGGCGGNANNFKSQTECEHRCLYPFLVPVPDPSPGPVKLGTCPILSQSNSTMCGEFCSTDASCPGNERCCETSCGHQCQRPIEVIPGYCPKEQKGLHFARPCLATCATDWDCGWGSRIPRKKCCRYGCWQTCREAEEEHPGVCPQRPVVQTFVPCNDSCSDDRDCPLAQKCCFTGCSLGCLDSVRSPQCQLPPEKGPCRGRIRRYFYSPSHKKCLRFFYGGCRGNSNNFKTVKECEETCGKISPEICKQPKETGQCLAYKEFFYYNSTTSSCEKFLHCGCKGNNNRFFTQLECLMACGNITKSNDD